MSTKSRPDPTDNTTFESLERYRLLFENTGDLVTMDEVIFNENGHPIDWILREVNPAYVHLTGVSSERAVGHRVTEVYGLDRANEDLLNAYAEAARTGRPVRLEASIPYLGRRFLVSIFPVGGNYFGRVMTDLSAVRAAQQESRAQHTRLQALLNALPVAVFLADADGRIFQANQRASDIWGGNIPLPASIEEYQQYKAWWHGSGEALKGEEWPLARVLQTGEAVTGDVLDILRFDGTCGTILVSAAPIIDAQGTITGGVVINQDITELVRLRQSLERTVADLKRESERTAVIEGIAEAGLSTLELDDLLATLAERIAQGLHTHSCAIMMLDERTNELVTKAAFGEPDALGFRLPVGTGFAGRLASERRTIYVANAKQDDLVMNPFLKHGKAKSLLGTPLIARDKVLGVAYVDVDAPREFTDEDIRLLESMAARAALALDNALLYEALERSRQELEDSLDKERYFSLLLQRALLPEVPHVPEGFQVAVCYVPAYQAREIGGDFYDVFAAGTEKLGIMVGDVSGKGLEAASMAAATRSTVHAFAHEEPSPGRALTRANSVIYAQQKDFGSFVTVFLAILDAQNGMVTYSSAGHPPPVVVHADGSVHELAYGQPPIALLDGVVYRQQQFALGQGETLVVYTDGISEARHDSIQFGTEGVERVLHAHHRDTPPEIAEAILSAATDWANQRLTDDVAIVVVQRRTVTKEVWE